jgi:hypothetical protein
MTNNLKDSGDLGPHDATFLKLLIEISKSRNLPKPAPQDILKVAKSFKFKAAKKNLLLGHALILLTVDVIFDWVEGEVDGEYSSIIGALEDNSDNFIEVNDVKITSLEDFDRAVNLVRS